MSLEHTIMTAAARKREDGDEPVTIAMFDDFVAGLPAAAPDYELIDGVIVLQQNPTDKHGQIVSNIGARLKLHMDQRGCHTFQGDMRVQRSDDNSEDFKVKPDIVVRCSPLTGRTYTTNPLIVVEVLSPSTMDNDRGPKRDFYKSLPTVMYSAIVYQDQMRIELDIRTLDGWEREILKNAHDTMRFDSAAFSIDLAQVYFGTELV